MWFKYFNISQRLHKVAEKTVLNNKTKKKGSVQPIIGKPLFSSENFCFWSFETNDKALYTIYQPNPLWVIFCLISNKKLYIIFFSLDMNQCMDNPCQNGGTFTNNDGCFTCTCADGWRRKLCNEGKHIFPPLY